MTTALLITTDDEFIEVEFENTLDYYYKHIKCDMIEIIKPHVLHMMTGAYEKFMMIGDEESLLKDNPKLNIYASAFYGGRIFGNVMIVKDIGEDFAGLEKEDHEELSLGIRMLMRALEQKYYR